MRKNKYKSIVSDISRFAILDLPTEAKIPDLLRLIRKIIPHDSHSFTWLDKYGSPINYYTDIAEPNVFELMFNAYHRFLEYFPNFSKTGDLVGNYKYHLHRLHQSDFYRRILEPNDQHHLLDGNIKINSDPLGVLVLMRGKSGQAFSKEDEEVLELTIPYFKVALQEVFEFEQSLLCPPKFKGVIVVSHHGDITHITPSVHVLLLSIARGNKIRHSENTNYYTWLSSLIQKVFKNINMPESKLPVQTYKTAQGKVCLKVYSTDALNSSNNGFCIAVSQQQCFKLELLRSLSNKPLSPKQKDVCMYFLLGKSCQDIASILKVSVTTVKDHLHKSYIKLGVSKKDELRLALQ